MSGKSRKNGSWFSQYKLWFLAPIVIGGVLMLVLMLLASGHSNAPFRYAIF